MTTMLFLNASKGQTGAWKQKVRGTSCSCGEVPLVYTCENLDSTAKAGIK